MLNRKITQQLMEWKNRENHMCLLVEGARQVGKTFSIDQFAKSNYKYYVYINFEQMIDAKVAFEHDLDVDTILMNLSIHYPHMQFIPHETILFFDEIQSCPQARTSLKFFTLDKRYDVIASGSLLGINYKDVSSYPVGYEEHLQLLSLDFEEFLWALNIQANITEYLRNCFDKKIPVHEAMHIKMKEYFIWYILVGGMPSAVNTFVSTKNFSKVTKVQKDIIAGYLQDISKYAKDSERAKARACFLSIPEQLSKPNKKFQYSSIEENSSNRKYEFSLQWLYDAGIIRYCYNLSEPRLPLAMHMQIKKYKIYMKDTGLLLAMMENDIQKAIFDGNLLVNNGAVFENIIAEMLLKNNKDLYYFERKGRLEIDFMCSLNGKLTALEVKSGDNLKAKSLAVLMSDMYQVPYGIKLTKDNVSWENNVLKLPWYMAMFL